MKYEVKYKTQGQWFWRNLRGVIGDGVMPENQNRWFLMEDHTRVELPKEMLLCFGPNRAEMIRRNMEEQAGRPIHLTTP